MFESVIDRVESKRIKVRYRRNLRFFVSLLICAIALIIISNKNERNSIFFWIVPSLFLVSAIYILYITVTQLKKIQIQFVDWQKDFIVYKLRNETNPVTIKKSEIKGIRTSLDHIVIETNTNQTYDLNIETIGEYEIRHKIKENFENNCT
jgi:hypothetical protein